MLETIYIFVNISLTYFHLNSLLYHVHLYSEEIEYIIKKNSTVINKAIKPKVIFLTANGCIRGLKSQNYDRSKSLSIIIYRVKISKITLLHIRVKLHYHYYCIIKNEKNVIVIMCTLKKMLQILKIKLTKIWIKWMKTIWIFISNWFISVSKFVD